MSLLSYKGSFKIFPRFKCLVLDVSINRLEFVSKKLTSTIAGAFIFITLLNVLGRGLGFFREMLFAKYFGMGHNFDIYLVGAVLPMTINTSMLYFAQNYFIPYYSSLKVSKYHSPAEFIYHTFYIFTIGSFSISIVLFLFSKSIISYFINPIDTFAYESALNIFQIFLITIPLNAIISVLISYQQAEFKFKDPAISRLILNLVLIPMLYFFNEALGIYIIPLAFVIGTVLQFVYLIIKVKLNLKLYNFLVISKRRNSGLGYTIIYILLIESISQLYLLADRYFFDFVGEGGLSALNYAGILYLLPISIISIALTTVIFPKLTTNIQRKEFEALNKNVSDAISANLFIFVPISFFFFFYGNDLIKILFERGKFSAENSMITFGVLKYYTISLVFNAAYSVYNKLLYGAHLMNGLVIITISGVILKIIMNFTLVGRYQQNGLALSTSISYIYFFLSSIILIKYRIPEIKHLLFFKNLFFYLITGLICYSIVEILFDSFYTLSYYKDIFKIILFYTLFLFSLTLSDHYSVKLIASLIRTIKTAKTI